MRAVTVSVAFAVGFLLAGGSARAGMPSIYLTDVAQELAGDTP